MVCTKWKVTVFSKSDWICIFPSRILSVEDVLYYIRRKNLVAKVLKICFGKQPDAYMVQNIRQCMPTP